MKVFTTELNVDIGFESLFEAVLTWYHVAVKNISPIYLTKK